MAEAGHGGDVCIPNGPCFGLSSQVSTVNLTNGSHTPLVSGLFSFFDPEGGALGIEDLPAQGGRLLGIVSLFPQAFAGPDYGALPSPPADCRAVFAAARSQRAPCSRSSRAASSGRSRTSAPSTTSSRSTIPEAQPSEQSRTRTRTGCSPSLAAPCRRCGLKRALPGRQQREGLGRLPLPGGDAPAEPFPTDAVPTCVARSNDHLVVADLAGRIWRVKDSSASIISDQASTLEANNHYTGCAADAAGNVYVVSMFTGVAPGPDVAMTGSILKVTPTGNVTTVVGGLFFPNKIAVGRDGALYVSTGSICTTAAPNPCGTLSGSIVKITP